MAPLSLSSSTEHPRATDKPSAGEHVPELDLLRFLAAAAVLAYHYFNWLPKDTPPGRVAGAGFLGVQLFFMISGFVILASASDGSSTRFVISRVARLYPTYWICLALTLLSYAMSDIHVPWQAAVANVTMIPTVLHQPMVNEAYWTLLVEIKFYVLVFVLIACSQVSRSERWLAVWTAVVALSTFGIAKGLALNGYAAYFASGCYFYLIRTRGSSKARLALLSVCMAAGVYYSARDQYHWTNDTSLASRAVAGVTVIVLHALFYLVSTRRIALPSLRLWGWLGALTYPLYLLHTPVREFIARQHPSLTMGERTFLAIAVSTALSLVIGIWLERPVRRSVAKLLRTAANRAGGTMRTWRRLPGRS